MKKIILSISLLLLTIVAYSQGNKPVKLDSLVSISMPAGYQVKDTMGERIFSANGAYGYMIAIREANAKNNTPLKKESDLNKVLKTYIQGIKKQSDANAALNVRDTLIGNRLKAKTFTLENGDGAGDITYRNFVLLYTQDVTYTFEFVYPDNRADMVKAEYKSFISSITLSPELQRNDQYISTATGMSTVTKIEIFGGAGLVLIFIVVMVVRKKKQPALS